jgi:hypothetical protein
MALVTTFMTTPLLQWIYPAGLCRQEVSPERSLLPELAGFSSD